MDNANKPIMDNVLVSNDFSSIYNTELSKEDEQKYQDFIQKQSKLNGRDMSKDTYDYDLKGWAKENDFNVNKANAHFNDKFKKPNHITFSDQSRYHGVKLPTGENAYGGRWGSDGKSYQPSDMVVKMHGVDRLIGYFKEREKGVNLNFKGTK